MLRSGLRLRHKLTLLLTVVAVVPVTVFSLVNYEHRKREIISELRSSLKETATTQSKMISADDVSAILKGESNSEAYLEMKEKLGRIIGHDGGKVSEAYILAPTANENVMRFVVDGQTDETKAAQFLEEYDVSELPELKQGLIEPSADNEITHDKWGYWLSGYAPIRNSDDVAVAVLGLDMKGSSVNQLKNDLFRSFSLYIIIGFISSAIIARLLASTIVRPVFALIEGVKRISEQRYGSKIDIVRRDEIGELIEIFNEMSQKLKEIDKLKSSFIAVVSHELRTPISPIRLGIEHLNLQANLSESAKKMLSIMEFQINKLNTKIEEVLAFSLLDTKSINLDRTPTSLVDITEDAIKHVSEAIKNKEILLERVFDDNLPVALVDNKYFKRVISILFENAVKFSPEKASVSVSIKKASSNTIEIAVSDRGIGFTSENTDSIFGGFYQEEDFMMREHGGLGVGLAIAKRIVEAHGGTITARSEGPGYGSTFTVTIPIS